MMLLSWYQYTYHTKLKSNGDFEVQLKIKFYISFVIIDESKINRLKEQKVNIEREREKKRERRKPSNNNILLLRAINNFDNQVTGLYDRSLCWRIAP